MMRYISFLLLGCIIVGSILAWPLLPDRIPARFGIGGEVTRWTDKTLISWFLLPALAAMLAFANAWLANALPRRPHLFNMPQRERFLRLPAERRQPVIVRMQSMLYGISAQVLALLTLVQISVYRTALGHSTEGLILGILLVSLAIVPVTLLAWLPGIRQEIDRQWRELERGHRPVG